MNTKYVTSLELSKQLKEAGIPQESEYSWQKNYFSSGYYLAPSQEKNYDDYSAFHVGELGEMLPVRWAELLLGEEGNSLIKIYKVRVDGGEIYWDILYSDLGKTPFVKKGEVVSYGSLHQEFEKNEAEARGKMLLYLKKGGLI